MVGSLLSRNLAGRCCVNCHKYFSLIKFIFVCLILIIFLCVQAFLALLDQLSLRKACRNCCICHWYFLLVTSPSSQFEIARKLFKSSYSSSMCGIQEVSRSSERFYILIIVKILLMAIIEQYVIVKIVNITYAIILTQPPGSCTATSPVFLLKSYIFICFNSFIFSSNLSLSSSWSRCENNC